MKLFKKIIHIVFLLVAVSLVTFIISMQLHPKETASFVGYRMYSVLTDSMEPRIPTNSLVFTKVVDKNDDLNLKKGDIVTFNANRFGEEVLITHHFNKMEKNGEGEWCYRTNPELTEELDMYETKREDIVGTYVFHIPYIGKLVLFLQSKFGFLMYAELFVIWCVNKLIKARWEEKELRNEKKNDPKEQENSVKDVEAQIDDIEEQKVAEVFDDTMVIQTRIIVYGQCICISENKYEIEILLSNHCSKSIRNVAIYLSMYDDLHNIMKTYKIYASKSEWIEPYKKHLLKFTCHSEQKLMTYEAYSNQYEMKMDDSL